jgi:hypothetical protein
MWLADIKYEFEGRMLVSVEAGSRFALFQCCCDYPTLASAEKESRRKQWKNTLESSRRKFAEAFGEWPKNGQQNWPGHHIRDLHHGGDPTDLGNILPVRPDIHDVFNVQYPLCYAGGAPWNTVGPDMPSRDL